MRPSPPITRKEPEIRLKAVETPVDSSTPMKPATKKTKVATKVRMNLCCNDKVRTL